MKKLLLKITAFVCVIAFAFGGYMLYLQMNEYTQGDKLYGDLTGFVDVPNPKAAPTHRPTESGSDRAADGDSDIAWPQVDFDALHEINPDIVGWLFCEDTEINYPVVQTDDNDYYLKHLFNRDYNANGCLFLDYRVSGDFSDSHSIIYGHNMDSGSMFSSLEEYKNQEYYDAHPQLLLVTPEADLQIKLFVGYVASVDDNAWNVDFMNESEFDSWLSSTLGKSTFKSSISPSTTNRIITLSTCSYEFDNARFILLGVMQKP